MDIRVVEVRPQQQEIPSEIDIAICYGKPNVGNRRLEDLISPAVFPVCSPTLLFGRETIEGPEQLTRLPLLQDDQNTWPRWFSAMDVEVPDSIRQTHFFSTALSLTAARNGFGVALCNSLEVQDDLREGRLVKVLEDSIPESHKYYLLCNFDEGQTLRAQLFEEWINKLMKNLPG
jgi:LysR family glycine cleavage system transcriptional activator